MTTQTGTVFRKLGSKHFVHVDGRTVACSLSSKLHKQLLYPTADPGSLHHRVVGVRGIAAVDPVAIGDIVEFTDSDDGTGMITNVLPRKNHFSRRAPGTKPLEQVIVANVDQVLAVMAAAQPAPKWNLLDRYLIAAEAADVPAVICITKMDLAEANRIEADMKTYTDIGYQLILTSCVTREGLDRFTDTLRGRTSVLLGKSGVGKTTLLNAIQPDLGLRVKEVSASTGKGKHTTTHLEMFSLDIGGQIVDTPGMREFGAWNVEQSDLAQLFPEMRPYLGQCRFAPCTHTHEPDCAVKQAVAARHITEHRYESYLQLRQ